MNKLKIFIALITLLLSSCTKTHFESYKFIGHGANSNNRDDKTHANIPIRNSIYEYKKTGILSSKKIRKEPYSYHFSICGNFNKIRSLEAHFVQNKVQKIRIPVTEKNIKITKTSKYSLCKLDYTLSYDKKIDLPITWDNTTTLEVKVNFIGIKKGIKRHYKLRGQYKKDTTKKNINLKWEAIMGI